MENNKPQPKNRIVLPILAIIFSVIFMGINYWIYLPFIPNTAEEAGQLAQLILSIFSLPIALIAFILSILSIVRTPKNKTESILKTITLIIFIILALPFVIVLVSYLKQAMTIIKP